MREERCRLALDVCPQLFSHKVWQAAAEALRRIGQLLGADAEDGVACAPRILNIVGAAAAVQKSPNDGRLGPRVIAAVRWRAGAYVSGC